MLRQTALNQLLQICQNKERHWKKSDVLYAKKEWHDRVLALKAALVSESELRRVESELRKIKREFARYKAEIEDATEGACADNPNEVHCTCVPLLKAKIKELKRKLRA